MSYIRYQYIRYRYNNNTQQVCQSSIGFSSYQYLKDPKYFLPAGFQKVCMMIAFLPTVQLIQGQSDENTISRPVPDPGGAAGWLRRAIDRARAARHRAA
jgi:hypothetical protein